jgi:hypothetical protein
MLAVFLYHIKRLISYNSVLLIADQYNSINDCSDEQCRDAKST